MKPTETEVIVNINELVLGGLYSAEEAETMIGHIREHGIPAESGELEQVVDTVAMLSLGYANLG